MHVLLIHQAFVTGDEAGSTRHYELSEHLADHEERVTVIASPISYLTGRAVEIDADDASGAEHPAPGIEVHRVAGQASLHRSFVSRLMNFFSFMVAATLRGLRVRDVDIVWGTTPPIFQAAGAHVVARLKRVPFVLEVRDLWPDFAVKTGVLRSRVAIWWARRLERFLYHHADQIVVNSPGFIDHICAAGVDRGNIELVANGVRASMYDPEDDGAAFRAELGIENSFVVLYAGAHGPANDLQLALQAAKLLGDKPGVVFVLVGDGKQRAELEQQARDMELDNVVFVGPQPKSRMPEILAAADVCFASLLPIPMFKITYPNKVFDYMAAGRPTVLAIDGVIRDVVEEADAGVCVDPGDPQQIAETIAWYNADPDLVRKHGANGRAFVSANFDREAQAEKLRATLRRAHRDRRINRWFPRLLKRTFDIALATAALVVLTPLMLLIALFVKLEDGGPVFFVQNRSGRREKEFPCYKFRTMVVGAETRGWGIEIAGNDDRITRVGRVLRATSLDEIPQIFNVLKGNMSVIGPRPTVHSQVAEYTDEQRRRLAVKPGMCGWAWIHGRNLISWERRIELDIWYIDNWSLRLDTIVFFKGIWMVLTRKGVYDTDGTVRGFKSGEGS